MGYTCSNWETPMTIEEIFKIANANATNKFITQHLDNETLEIIISIMEKLDSSCFKEINPDAEFEFTDIPIPYKLLNKGDGKQTKISAELHKQFSGLLQKINEKDTNIEYPFVMRSLEDNDEYSKLKPFDNGGLQTCSFDWEWIEDYIKNLDGKIKLSLLHTHPNPLDHQHNTLFNKYPEILSECKVQANGLNISLEDVYACQYLQMLAEKYNKEIEVESCILMFDGTLISFSTKNGLTLTSEFKIDPLLAENKSNNITI